MSVRGRLMTTRLLAVFLLAASVSAADSSIGMVSLNKNLNVRSMGMGGVSQGSGGMMASWSNPAFLMDMETPGEVALGGGALNGGNEVLTSIGAGWRLSNKFVVGGIFGYNGISFKENDGFGYTVGNTLGDNTLSLGLLGAYNLDLVTAGISLKYVRENMMENSDSGIACDVGLNGAWNGFSLGLSMRNFGPMIVQPKGNDTSAYKDGVNLPVEFRGGLAYQFTSFNIRPAVEVRQPIVGGLPPVLGLGLDWWPAQWFTRLAARCCQ